MSASAVRYIFTMKEIKKFKTCPNCKSQYKLKYIANNK